METALNQMPLLRHLKLHGDKIPSAVLTAPSLRCLQTMKLNGNVEWNVVTLEILQLRPNLVYLKANGVPSDIRDKLKGIIIES